MHKSPLSVREVEQFVKDGFLIKKRLITGSTLVEAQQLANRLYANPLPPVELEASVGYPGAPMSMESEGGQTVRRLLSLCSRDSLILEMASSGVMASTLKQLIRDSAQISLNPNHHNCLMTKAPNYSSDTNWHQDIRYWSFKRQELVSAWVSLGTENASNGALQVIPGSHTEKFDTDQFDSNLFFIDDLEKNRPLTRRAMQVELEAGDVLFFDSRLLHRASRNSTNKVKFSMVFTYHGVANKPLANTRSARLPEIQLNI